MEVVEMNSNFLELVRDGDSEKKDDDVSRRREKGDVISWRASSMDHPYIFEIKVDEGITIILIDTCTETVLIVHNPWHADLFVMRFRGMTQLLGYLETCCSDSGKYVFKDPEYDCGAYVHRRDLLDVLVMCMAKIPHYTKPFVKDE
jgi:hypothetical protein